MLRDQSIVILLRYRYNMGLVMGETRKSILKWADGKIVKEEIDAEIFKLLGPKTAEDSAPVIWAR